MMARTQRGEVRKAISHYFHRYRHVDTEIKGRDLKAMGIAPGRVYRVILDELLDARLNGEVKNREEEVAYIRWRHPDLFKDSGNGFRAA